MGLGYAIFVGAGVWHFVGGWAWWLGWRSATGSGKGASGKTAGSNGGYLGSSGGGNEYKRKRRVKWAVNGVAILSTTLWLAGGLGVIGREGEGFGWEAKNWDKIYKAVPMLGTYLLES